MIGYLIELDKKVPLKELVDKGLIDWKVIRDRDVYMHYDALVKTGTSIMDAYKNTANEWRLSSREIMRIIKSMKDDRKSNTH